jgi:hypothetical protein
MKIAEIEIQQATFDRPSKTVGEICAKSKLRRKNAITRLLLLFLALLVSIRSVSAEELPGWAKRDYATPTDLLFTAALKSIQEQHHEVKSTDDANHTVDFHVGTTAWSWGYNMRLTVTQIDEAHSRVVVGISRSGGKAVSWGSGKKEVLKIFTGIDAELASQKSRLK